MEVRIDNGPVKIRLEEYPRLRSLAKRRRRKRRNNKELRGEGIAVEFGRKAEPMLRSRRRAAGLKN